MPKICKKYAIKMHNVCKIRNMQKVCKKHAEGLTNMQRVQYAEHVKSM